MRSNPDRLESALNAALEKGYLVLIGKNKLVPRRPIFDTHAKILILTEEGHKMRDWLMRQYHDIKGNAKWALLVALWWIAVHYAKEVLQLIPNIPGWLVTSILLCLSLGMFLWVAKLQPSPPKQTTIAQSFQHLPTFPSVSSLQGQVPQVTFNANEFFRLAYYSPVTAEVENNIKTAAHNAQPNDHEAFYSRFIGVGLVSCMHDLTWAYIFRSQLLMLQQLSSIGGIISAADAKAFYDRAKAEYPAVYASYSFDQWLDFMKTEQLVLQHPTNMVEITHRGKDFLRYLAHCGRSFDLRKS